MFAKVSKSLQCHTPTQVHLTAPIVASMLHKQTAHLISVQGYFAQETELGNRVTVKCEN